MVQKWPHDDLAKGPSKHPSFSPHPPSRLHCYQHQQDLALRHEPPTCSLTSVHHMTHRPTYGILHAITLLISNMSFIFNSVCQDVRRLEHRGALIVV